MHIAYCGPISLRILAKRLQLEEVLPDGYQYPLGAHFVLGLLAAGLQVSVVTHCSECAVPQRLRFGPLSVSIFPLRRPRHVCLDFYRAEVRALKNELRFLRPDLVHAQWTYEFAAGAIACGRPYIVTGRDSPPKVFSYQTNVYWLFRLIFSYLVLPRIRRLYAVSPYLQAEYRRWYLKKDVTIVPNGLADEFFHMRRPPIQSERPVIVSITAWNDVRKNAKVALRMFPMVRREFPKARLLLIGHGLGAMEQGIQWAKGERLEEGVEFLGYLSHAETVRVVHDQADVFVHTTLEETFCMAIVEAMGAGVPVVAGRDSGAVSWVLGDGRFGWLANVQDEASVAGAVMDVLKNPELAEKVAREGFSHARQHYSMSRMVNSYINHYNRELRRC